MFGSERRISVPYDPAFARHKRHYSNLYFGASLPALEYLADRKGYSLVASTTSGANAFFVRSDLVRPPLQALSAKTAFHNSQFRESRTRSGRLSYAAGAARAELIRGLPVVNVETQAAETF